MHHVLLSGSRAWALLLWHLLHTCGESDVLGEVPIDALQAQAALLDSAFAARQDSGRWLAAFCFWSADLARTA